MTPESRWKTLATIGPLCLLIVGEMAIASIEGGRTDKLSVSLQLAIAATAPLFVVVAAVLRGSNPAIAVGCASISICVGAFMQAAYLSSHDPSKIFLLAVGWFTYWICGFVALFLLGKKRP